MAVDIQTRDGGVYGLRITRGEAAAAAFSPDDRARCQLLLPHLRRALDLHLSVNQDRQVQPPVRAGDGAPDGGRDRARRTRHRCLSATRWRRPSST
jgi:hypothetical protein